MVGKPQNGRKRALTRTQIQGRWRAGVKRKKAQAAKDAEHAEAKAKRDSVIQRRAEPTRLANEQRAAMDREYAIVLADPASKFDTWSDRGKDRTNPDNHYPTQTWQEIAAAAPPLGENAILFCWSTGATFNRMLRVVEDDWKLTYKTTLGWDKERIATGYWARGQLEFLIVAIKGKGLPTPLPWDRLPSLFIETADKQHSRKPEAVYRWIEENWENVPKLEMYARRKRPGWAADGNEVDDSE
jgi:N6-adenosine-specific RNA methylase IME4